MKNNTSNNPFSTLTGFDALAQAIQATLTQKGRVFVAIDGQCGSGKSTLAAALAERWDATLVHMDDFFLRPEQHTPARLAEPGGNVDRERFYTEALAPLQAGRDASYRPFDCHAFQLRGPAPGGQP